MKRTSLPRHLHSLLNTVRFVSVATVCVDGRPWNTPVAAYFDDDLNMYWASWTKNQHSINVAANGQAFTVVYDSTPFVGQMAGKGLYIEQKVRQLSNKQEVQAVLQVYDDRLDNTGLAADFTGRAPRRIYKAEPISMWANRDGKAGGRYVDKRQRIR